MICEKNLVNVLYMNISDYIKGLGKVSNILKNLSMNMIILPVVWLILYFLIVKLFCKIVLAVLQLTIGELRVYFFTMPHS